MRQLSRSSPSLPTPSEPYEGVLEGRSWWNGSWKPAERTENVSEDRYLLGNLRPTVIGRVGQGLRGARPAGSERFRLWTASCVSASLSPEVRLCSAPPVDAAFSLQPKGRPVYLLRARRGLGRRNAPRVSPATWFGFRSRGVAVADREPRARAGTGPRITRGSCASQWASEISEGRKWG